jgi:hypothetical protein
VKIDLEEMPAKELNFKTQPISSSLVSGSEAKFNIAIECLKPFVDFPKMTVSFSSYGTVHSYALSLPCSPASFFEAVPMDKQTYMSR